MDKKLIREASKNLELMDVTIIQQSIQTDWEAYSFGAMMVGDTSQQHRSHAEVVAGEYEVEDSTVQAVIVYAHFGTRLVPESEDESVDDDVHVYAEIAATVRIEYGVIGKLPSEEALQEFADFNAIHNAYPFWRELVFSLANKAKLPPVFVPLYRDAAYGHVSRTVVPHGNVAKSKRIKKKKDSRQSKAKSSASKQGSEKEAS